MFIKDISCKTPKTNRSSHPYERSDRTVRAGGYTGVSSNPPQTTATQALNQIFNDMSNALRCYAVEPNTTSECGGGVSRRSDKEAVKPENGVKPKDKAKSEEEAVKPENEIKPKNETKSEEEVKAALKAANIDFDSLSDDIKTDVLKKYETYTSVLKLTDDVKKSRITNYVKALQAHKIEIAMGDFDSKVFTEALKEVAKDPENPTPEELERAKTVAHEKRQTCELKIEDSNIENQRATGTDEEYFGALKGRGEGSVDMYDTDNDGKISFTEFKTFEEKDGGMTLNADETAEFQQCFDKMDRNNDHYIDANEMASHLYAVSRMHDKGDGPNTVSDITFGEWHDSQKFTSDPDVSARYDAINSQLYGVLKKD